MTNKKVIVDQDKCIGCNTCPILNPDIFELDPETYKARVKKQPQSLDEVETAITACPVTAILIEEEK